MNFNYHQKDTIKSELVFGLVGPIGCNREGVVDVIRKCAKPYGYKVILIEVSKLMREVFDIPRTSSTYKNIKSMMDHGNIIRGKTGSNSILIKLAAEQIRIEREKHPNKKRLFIVNSIKHPDEVIELRAIYPQGFYLFAIHVNEQDQINFLKEKCKIRYDKQIDDLIQYDRFDENKNGQKTSQAFHMADFFINQKGYNRPGATNERIRLENVVTRFFKIIFGHPYTTPLFNEFAMFMAFASSSRSADMSRQVGAAICKGENILTVGVNECPKYSGGVYSPIYDPDIGMTSDIIGGRDFTRKKDSNSFQNKQIIKKLTQNISGDSKKKLLENIRNSGINDITEFGRAVHAEMDAILSCARQNISIKNAKLFCTTFPCHNCTKHIVASGIKEVFYIEPYPKSKATEMHDDSITENWEDIKKREEKKVFFRPFIGVGPRLFINLFSVKYSTGSKLVRRKNSGLVDWDESNALPRVKLIPLNYLEREFVASREVFKKLIKLTNKIKLKDNSNLLKNIKSDKDFSQINFESQQRSILIS